jgi:hypothetical protein
MQKLSFHKHNIDFPFHIITGGQLIEADEWMTLTDFIISINKPSKTK